MALSGTIYQNVGSYWRLQIEWSATQNISNNTSTVTARMYWIDRGSNTGISSSSSKSGYITIDGTQYSFTATAGLNRGQKKQIATATKTITHGDDGRKSITIGGRFNIAVTLSGTYYSNATISNRSVTLDTIPRASTLVGNASWTAGSNKAINISRASTSFYHGIDIAVKNVNGYWIDIKSLSYDLSTTSGSTSFSTADHKLIFQAIGQRANAETRIIVRTITGGNEIGRNTYYGTVTAPARTIPTSDFDRYVYTDETIHIPLSRQNSNFLHSVTVKLGSFSKTWNNVATSVTWTPTSSEENQLTAQMKNDKIKRGSVEITTYYDGTQVRTTHSSFIDFYVRNASPIFSSSQIDYYDSNSTVTNRTGNNKVIVQNLSTLVAQITSGATPQKNATISRYVIKVGGHEKSRTTTGNQTVGKIESNKNVTLTVTVHDSRGFTTTVSKTVTVEAYEPPKIFPNARRRNNFEEAVLISATGSYSRVLVGGVFRNTVTKIEYRYKQASSSSWSGWNSMTFSNFNGNLNIGNTSRNLNNTQAYDFEFRITDYFTNNTVAVRVNSGRPILFIDPDRKSVAINKFSGENQIQHPVDKELPRGLEVSGGAIVGDGYFEIASYNRENRGVGMVQFFYDANESYLRAVKRDENYNSDEDLRLWWRGDIDAINGHFTNEVRAGNFREGGVNLSSRYARLGFSNTFSGTNTFNGHTNMGTVTANRTVAPLTHSEGYFYIQPFNDGYDNGTNARAYYDGNERTLRWTVSGGGSIDLTHRAYRFTAYSLEEFKDNIEEWDDSVLDLYRDELTLYKYTTRNGDLEDVQHGLVIGEGYKTPEVLIDGGEGVSLYEFSSHNARAIQELIHENDTLKERVESLEARIEQLEAK